MVASLDGRLLHERWTGLPEEAIDLYEAIADSFDADGWIVGRTTMETYLPSGPENLTDMSGGLADHIGDRADRPLAIAFDRTGKLLPDSDEVEGCHLVLLLSEQVAKSHVDALIEKGVSVIFSGPEGSNIEKALDTISEAFGAKTLLLEGGGILNGAFLKKKLIDETSTLIVPVLDGQSGIPSIYDHQGEICGQPLKLLDIKRLEHDAVWLHHAF